MNPARSNDIHSLLDAKLQVQAVIMPSAEKKGGQRLDSI
jgi:hypothetical protein